MYLWREGGKKGGGRGEGRGGEGEEGGGEKGEQRGVMMSAHFPALHLLAVESWAGSWEQG